MVPGKIGKYSRSVSIIGVGAMPFGDTGENPELKGLTEGEFFGAAALMAMEMQELSRETLISFTMALPIQSFLTMQQHLTCRLQSGSECGEKALSTTQRHAVPVMWVWNRL